MSRLKLALFVAAVFAVSACAARQARLEPHPGEPTLPVYIVSHGRHTGIVVRRSDIPAGLWPEAGDFPDADHIEVGWGEREYYPARDPGVWLLLKAAFGPSPSVLHAVGFRGPPAAQFRQSEIVALALPTRDFERLAKFVSDTYARGGEPRAPQLGPGLYGDSYFYPALGTFHLFRNCNVWTARALRAAGVPVHDAITMGGVMSQVRRLGTLVSPAPRSRPRSSRVDSVKGRDSRSSGRSRRCRSRGFPRRRPSLP